MIKLIVGPAVSLVKGWSEFCGLQQLYRARGRLLPREIS